MVYATSTGHFLSTAQAVLLVFQYQKSFIEGLMLNFG